MKLYLKRIPGTKSYGVYNRYKLIICVFKYTNNGYYVRFYKPLSLMFGDYHSNNHYPGEIFKDIKNKISNKLRYIS